jgi:predicted ATP-grasp superfamily ATP-dependent carboligase
VARSLGRLGVPVHALAHVEPSLVLASRHCAGRVEAGWNGHPEGAPDEEIVDQLVAAGRRLGERPILLCGSDQWALLVAAHASRLAGVFDFPHVPVELVRGLTSKVGLHDLARSHGLPTPLVRCPGSVEEALAAAREMTFPVVLKNTRSRPGQELALASDPRELVERFLAMGGPGEVVLQEHIPGGDEDVWMYNGYFDRSSRCLASFTGRKIRQVPPGLGLCTAGVCVENPEVARLMEAFLGAVGYRGVVDVDFRRDPRDGRYKVLDVNPRLGGVVRLFVDPGGLDVARAMYLDLTGRTVPRPRPNEGRKWFVEAGEVIALRRYRRERGLTVTGWLRSLRGVREMATFSASDPLPFLVAMRVLASDTLGGRWQQLLARARRRLPYSPRSRYSSSSR